MNGRNTTVKAKTGALPRPHSAYNIFFILERTRLAEDSAGEGLPATSPHITKITSPVLEFSGYDMLRLPILPPRFRDLQSLPLNWFVPGRNVKRKHVATNGSEWYKHQGVESLYVFLLIPSSHSPHLTLNSKQ